jgi:hypothetical protein
MGEHEMEQSSSLRDSQEAERGEGAGVPISPLRVYP